MWVSSDRPCTGISGIDRSVDIPANAKPKGDHRLHATEKFSERLRFYPASIPWAWAVELYARSTLLVGSERFSDLARQITSGCCHIVGG